MQQFDLGGFSITKSTSNTMLIIFAIYSVIIVGLGFLVKYKSIKDKSNNLKSLLTGGGALSAFAIAMIAATNSMAGGTMITAPGLGYKVGYTAALIYYGGFLTACYSLGSIGRKAAILRARTGAVSFLRILRLRFQSKALVGALSITGAFGLTFFAAGQITAGAKVFAAVTGSNKYYLGLVLTIVITVIYTMSGGVKSMAKVAQIQGIVMLFATISILGILVITNAKTYGSVAQALQALGTTYPNALKANSTFTFWNALGTSIFAGIGLGVLPHAVSVTVTFDDHAKLKRGIIISCIVFTIVQGIMCGTGPLARAINPNIQISDYVTIFTATNLLPSWLGGIIFCGVFSAIQSTIAGLSMAAAANLAKDFLIDCYGSKMNDKSQQKLNLVVVIGIALIGTIISLKPSDLTQYMINFAIGAICSAWYWPIMLGMYWKKATRIGALLSAIGGYTAYIIFYFMQSVIPVTKVWWASSLGGVAAFLPAWIISLLLFVIGSYATQHDMVKLGYFQVFFCDEYDEKYTQLD